MGSRLSLGKAVNLSVGMWQWSVLLLTRTCTRQPIPPEALQILPPPGRKSSTQTFPAVTPSNHWHLRHWAHSVPPLRSFWRNLVVAFQHPPENRARLPFFFSVCLSLFKGSTLFWFKKPLIYPTANRTSSLSSFFYQFLNFVFSPGIFTPKGIKIIIIIARYMVHPSVRLLQRWIIQQRLMLRLWNFHHTVAPSLQFLQVKFHPEIIMVLRARASNKGGVGKTSHFLALNVNISKMVRDTAKVTINH